MAKETMSDRDWAMNQLKESDCPFKQETLEAIGEVDGVIQKFESGQMTVTVEAMEELLATIGKCRSVSNRCLRSESSSSNRVNTKSSDN